MVTVDITGPTALPTWFPVGLPQWRDRLVTLCVVVEPYPDLVHGQTGGPTPTPLPGRTDDLNGLVGGLQITEHIPHRPRRPRNYRLFPASPDGHGKRLE